MKKITLGSLLCILLSISGFSQTLNQTADWTNGSWSVDGTYTNAGLLSDPGTDGFFSFDDDAAGSGSDDLIFAESPVIDLTAAYNNNETLITVSSDYIYRILGDVFSLEYWDADASAWVSFYQFSGNSMNEDYKTCSSQAAFTSDGFSISGFTPTQLSGFKYRIFYSDGPGEGFLWGFCVSPTTITSATGPACGTLGATDVNIEPSDISASFTWTPPLSQPPVTYDWEIVTDGGTRGVDTVDSGSVAGNVVSANSSTSLIVSTDYDLYIDVNCGGSTVTTGPISFTTLGGPPPINDLCTGAIDVTMDVSTFTVGTATELANDSVEFTVNSNTQAEICNGFVITSPETDMWYTFTARNNFVNIDVQTDFDAVLFLYSGSCGALTLEDCSDDSATVINPGDENITATTLSPGVTYYVRVVSGAPNPIEPDFTLKIWSPLPQDASLSIEEPEVVNTEVKYYPNPVRDIFHINANATIQNISVYNILGQQVLNVTPEANTLSSEVNMSELNQGTYIVKASIEGVTKTMRVIKQ